MTGINLTQAHLFALRWLKPGSWHEPSVTTARSLYRLARRHPDLCETRLRKVRQGSVAQYRLTAEGEKVRSELT